MKRCGDCGDMHRGVCHGNTKKHHRCTGCGCAVNDLNEAVVCGRCRRTASGCKCVGPGGSSGPFHLRAGICPGSARSHGNAQHRTHGRVYPKAFWKWHARLAEWQKETPLEDLWAHWRAGRRKQLRSRQTRKARGAVGTRTWKCNECGAAPGKEHKVHCPRHQFERSEAKARSTHRRERRRELHAHGDSRHLKSRLSRPASLTITTATPILPRMRRALEESIGQKAKAHGGILSWRAFGPEHAAEIRATLLRNGIRPR